MQELLTTILEKLRAGQNLTPTQVASLMRKVTRAPADQHNDSQPFYTKAEILAYYQERRGEFALGADLEKKLLALLQVKPIRTQSGVATVTILTKPWLCPGQCIFCPSDLRMPKSYLSDEPGAQRAEINFFDPYLQTTSRLKNLAQMGHNLDKIEMIILGGTWDNYPQDYQRWFIAEVFRALNEFENKSSKKSHAYRQAGEQNRRLFNPAYRQAGKQNVLNISEKERIDRYLSVKMSNEREINKKRVQNKQSEVNQGLKTYNNIISEYLQTPAQQNLATWQRATWEEVETQQHINETARARCVGLVIETRPDLINDANCQRYRRLGCTKIQMGVQSLDDEILLKNGRGITEAKIAESFSILRQYGFKIHIHFMANLLGATVEKDKKDYEKLVTDARFLPDEIKIYPCSLIESARLMKNYENKTWQPYSESELLDLLVSDMLATPPYMRLTRIIRDISSHDIVVGNKKTNFRQLVEDEIKKRGQKLQEIRSREIKNQTVTLADLRLDDVVYQTAISEEHFLQWVTSENKIAGFLRLSLPYQNQSPFGNDVAMIREIHVYGRAATLNSKTNSQHLGLGKKLLARAREIAKQHHYQQLWVISAVGTRQYYLAQGFENHQLFQRLWQNDNV